MTLRRTKLFAYPQGKLITAYHDNEGLLTHTPKSSAQSQTNFPAPHPLALELVKRLPPGARRVLEYGPGSGRNLRTLLAAVAEVWPVSNFAELPKNVPAFEGALSTHALLHGTVATIGSALAQIAARMSAGAPFCATFGSVRDARFGKGNRLEDGTFASTGPDEAGVPHSYFGEPGLRALLDEFNIERLDEVRADDVAGKWAHVTTPLQGAVHWFLIATKKI